jgi:hypothetical protein
MKMLFLLACSFFMSPFVFLAGSTPITTECALFLFDNGDKNMIASMLNFAQKQDRERLKRLDFKIVFMGPSAEGMAHEPFCNYPDKLIHYKELGVEESIDAAWKRERKISPNSLGKLLDSLRIKKKVWLTVSCAVCEQIATQYDKEGIAVAAFRDNPSPIGDTDYFTVAEAVQQAAQTLIVPSALFCFPEKKVIVVGSGPIEEWCDASKFLNKQKIRDHLELSTQLPILVFTGSYGVDYEARFRYFLDLLPAEAPVELLIVPHPRFKGALEKQICAERNLPYKILGEFETHPARKIKTIEALFVADAVATVDATSTVVYQANALKKKVLYPIKQPSKASDLFFEKRLLLHVTSSEEVLYHMKEAKEHPADRDVFELLDMPKEGAQRLWSAFLAGLPSAE